MPFKSDEQREYMFANHPEIAKRWAAEQEAAKKKAQSPWADVKDPDMDRGPGDAETRDALRKSFLGALGGGKG